MSGPVERVDLIDGPDDAAPDLPPVEVTPSRDASVGAMQVSRALPHRARRTIGAWCFVDHMLPGPAEGGGIGPHPHIGLQTVTWLVSGELLHRDSLGTEQVIRPGQLNLMTAGRGIAHAEENPLDPTGLHQGVQFWVAQPDATRHGDPAFEHHGELPVVEIGNATATVLVGALAGAVSPARHDTPLLGAEVQVRAGTTTVELDPTFEHGVVVLEGAVAIEGVLLEPRHLAHVDRGLRELVLTAEGPARLVLIGGPPFEATPLMWWNYVARTRDEVWEAHDAWEAGDDRFAPVGSRLDRIASPAPPWRR